MKSLPLVPFSGVRRNGAGLIAQINSGFPISRFTKLAASLAVPEIQLARHLGISSVQLRRLKKSGKLNRFESDRLQRYYRIFKLATEIHEGISEARQWLKKPLEELAEETPLEHCETEVGAREIEALLNSVRYEIPVASFRFQILPRSAR